MYSTGFASPRFLSRVKLTQASTNSLVVQTTFCKSSAVGTQPSSPRNWSNWAAACSRRHLPTTTKKQANNSNPSPKHNLQPWQLPLREMLGPTSHTLGPGGQSDNGAPTAMVALTRYMALQLTAYMEAVQRHTRRNGSPDSCQIEPSATCSDMESVACIRGPRRSELADRTSPKTQTSQFI